MKLDQANAIGVAFLFAFTLLFFTGCADSAHTVAGKYTEETAKAIIETGWHIATAIVAAAFIRGCMS